MPLSRHARVLSWPRMSVSYILFNRVFMYTEDLPVCVPVVAFPGKASRFLGVGSRARFHNRMTAA